MGEPCLDKTQSTSMALFSFSGRAGAWTFQGYLHASKVKVMRTSRRSCVDEACLARPPQRCNTTRDRSATLQHCKTIVMVVRAERVLFITTSVGEVGDGRKRTGLWLGSLAEPYYLFQKNGYIAEVASMRGGSAPIDPLSMEKPHSRHPMVKRFLADGEALGLLDNTSSVAYISAERYSAIFITDGLGIAVDAPYSKELQRLLSEAFAARKVVAAVGRGVAALLSAKITDPKHPQAGMPIVYGKQVTGYSKAEEELSGHASEVPFLVEDRIAAVGGEYTRGNRNEGAYANKAGLIITGQNAASALQVAELVVEALSYGVRLTP